MHHFSGFNVTSVCNYLLFELLKGSNVFNMRCDEFRSERIRMALTSGMYSNNIQALKCYPPSVLKSSEGRVELYEPQAM